MLTKTKIASIVVVMIAVVSIGGLTQLQKMSGEVLQETPSVAKYPMPPPIKLGNYGQYQEFADIKSENDNVTELSSNKISDLKLVDSRISHGGHISVFYAPTNVRHIDDTPLTEFLKNGGIVVIHSEIGENYDVDERISTYVDKTGNPDLSFEINGDRAIGVMKNVEFDMPTKIHIYQDNGQLVTLLGWQTVPELQKIAEALE